MVNIEDLSVAHAEHDSDRVRASHYAGDQGLEREYTRRRSLLDDVSPPTEAPNPTGAPSKPVEEVEEAESVSSYDNESTRTGARHRSGPLRSGSHLTQTSTKYETDIMDYLDRHPTAVRRIQHHRLQHSMTVGSRRSGPVDLPLFGGGKPFPPPLPEQEEYVVEFEGHEDPRHGMSKCKAGSRT